MNGDHDLDLGGRGTIERRIGGAFDLQVELPVGRVSAAMI
jgi:hypothetical protein